MNPPVEERSQPLKVKMLHQLAVEMVVRMNVILKSARIYAPNNLLFQRQITLFLELVRKALAEAGEASFTTRAGTLFFNNIRLKYGFANYHFFKFILEEFRKKQIGGIRFDRKVAEGDLKTLMLVLRDSGRRGREARPGPHRVGEDVPLRAGRETRETLRQGFFPGHNPSRGGLRRPEP
jgi:hypothetical protein